MNDIEKLKNIDNGRFSELLETFDLKEGCFKCGYFDKSKERRYRCAVMPHCIGITLSEDTKKYLLNKMEDDGNVPF